MDNAHEGTAARGAGAIESIVVGLGTCGIAAGAEELLRHIQNRVVEEELGVEVTITGCQGMCYSEPQIELKGADGSSFLYGNLDPAKFDTIVKKHIKGGEPVDRLLLKTHEPECAEYELMSKQLRIVLRNCGCIDPESLDDYLETKETGGYEALRAVLERKDPEWVVKEITDSGLRGRGGAGFLTGMKWKFARQAQADRKFVVCNADEGDPGAFMDRSTLEGDPHSVLEGMAICGYAIGADHAYIYCRAEYPLAIKRLRIAIAAAEERHLLGDDIMGSGFSFHVKLKEGAGAFVCGEETALMASIEGRRGMPRIRPPFPAQSGLWGKPTNINNVETFANVPWIVRKGAAAFAALGTPKSKGTKVFALAGKIKRGGLVEVPMGITLQEIVEEIGGGTPRGRPAKAVQMGGPSGGCVPQSLFHTRIDYDEVTATGAIMGSGGMVVMDDTSCMVDIARYFLDFTQKESCGKCTFCRVGTKRMLEILTRICEGKGQESDIPLLETLALQVKHTSLCGLGQTAPNPVLTTIRYFRDEYLEHINGKRCRSGKCAALTTFGIDAKTCTGCRVCAKNCPTEAIIGEKKQPHQIVQDKCIRCGVCRDVCKEEAVVVL
jgi:NADH-quinone oxidoreductase subunit F